LFYGSSAAVGAILKAATKDPRELTVAKMVVLECRLSTDVDDTLFVKPISCLARVERDKARIPVYLGGWECEKARKLAVNNHP
tara:strand:- start:921 stop:1169 length:249 start_codon:yes stop_codon:yes gene_type:complete